LFQRSGKRVSGEVLSWEGPRQDGQLAAFRVPAMAPRSRRREAATRREFMGDESPRHGPLRQADRHTDRHTDRYISDLSAKVGN
jgi:hypothetical protein